MKKNYIWILISLMTVALIGIIVIQSFWINWSINLNQEKFDKEVFSALNNVEKELAARENTLDLDVMAANDLTKGGLSRSKIDFYYRQGKLTDTTQISKELSSLLTKGRSSFQQQLTLLEGLEVNRLLRSKELTDRIDLKQLSSALKRHLVRRDIDVGYHYGVYSTKSESFVILDDNFVVVEEGNQFTNTEINRSLFNSQYKINLFETEDDLPGILFIEFPTRRSMLFKDVWPTILGSLLFVTIILLCFAYTIHVIFRQKKLSEMRNDFINNMTHEFKTPIATINLAADSITSPVIVSEPTKVSRFATIIKQENSRMLSQVEKVLQMALLEKKDFKLRMSDINIHEIILQAVEHANLQVEKKGGRVYAELRAGKPVIRADQTHISNIIYNLLDNANKYSPDAPDIKITTENALNGIRITIADKGLGMTKDQVKHIFDKFYRVHTGNIHDVKGFGLGLAYVKAMISAHKGTVDVQSEVGKGSEFILFLPFDSGQENHKNGVS